jgi:phage gp45-like
MTDPLRRVANAVRLMLTRGKALRATLGARTFLQVAGLAGETFNRVELLLPYGRSALPLAGDVLILQILGSRDHKVALCADDPSLRITDLQSGEFGDRDARGTQIVYRQNRLEITTPLKIVVTSTGDVDVTSGTVVNITAPQINLGSSGEMLHKLIDDRAAAVFNAHVHSGVTAGGGSSGPPTTTLGSGQETSVVSAG